jgi:hypothetical protein
MTSLACNLGAFDADELQRYGQLRQAIRAATRETEELADGYRLGLRTASRTFLTAAEWIVLEHRCCPFLSFSLELKESSEVWLSITGPEGVKAFLGEAIAWIEEKTSATRTVISVSRSTSAPERRSILPRR